MSPILECINNKKTNKNPVWFMRQAGRYLPEFRKIREKNPDFIKLCLNEYLLPEITLQPLKRFELDAAIFFSDILMIPYGLGQKIEFKKNFGPLLNKINLDKIDKINETSFINKLYPIYKSLKTTSNNKLILKKDLIGFVGAPWTLLVYMLNKQSPKNKLKEFFFKDKSLINRLLQIIEKFIKLHINHQVKNGASIIQIFDSWAGLLDSKDLPQYVYIPTLRIVNYVKSLNVPVICFPRNIKNYKEFSEIVKPNVINIDYEVDPKKIIKELNITIQGGLDPRVLLTDKENIKKKASVYLNIFKDHPYIFNLGHGILPETKPEMVDYLVNIVKGFK
jgi:uroporphyrinogen decarboxylase